MKVPSPQFPAVTPQGLFTSVWAQFFASLGNAAPAIVAVTPGASPFAYTATQDGFMAISGGTVSALSLKRGPTTIALNPAPGCIPMANGDVLTVTYSAAPTMSFVPS